MATTTVAATTKGVAATAEAVSATTEAMPTTAKAVASQWGTAEAVASKGGTADVGGGMGKRGAEEAVTTAKGSPANVAEVMVAEGIAAEAAEARKVGVQEGRMAPVVAEIAKGAVAAGVIASAITSVIVVIIGVGP